MMQFNGDLIEGLRMIADLLEKERAKVWQMHDDALEIAALIADQVEATARPGDGKDAAAEIARRIRALMDGTR